MTTPADRLLPEALWQRLQPLLPPPPSHAHGGAPRTVSDRACMAAIIFMARTSTPWALLPVAEFGCGSVSTCWRRFAEWAAAGVFERLQELLLDELGEAGGLDWSRISVNSVSLRAVREVSCPHPPQGDSALSWPSGRPQRSSRKAQLKELQRHHGVPGALTHPDRCVHRFNAAIQIDLSHLNSMPTPLSTLPSSPLPPPQHLPITLDA
jgi:transposase